MADLLAGVARATNTPPVGIPLVGFAGRGPSEAVHDDLTATALALESGDVRALILTADLLFFRIRHKRMIPTREGFQVVIPYSSDN